ncbi:hypothetical protein LCGC14_1704860, partial [marine sediment metagenome]
MSRKRKYFNQGFDACWDYVRTALYKT